MHREGAIELLWPGIGSPQGDNRLAVAISRARSVLDPGKVFPQDHYLRGLEDVIWLRIHILDIDVERFLGLAASGLKAFRVGRPDDAQRDLEEAYGLYGGDFLEDQAYEDWTMPLREEARAGFISVALALGEVASQRSHHETAVALYSRVLDKDPYAEDAHLGLVHSAQMAGRHGEAQRLYLVYTGRMAELEIEPAPYPVPKQGRQPLFVGGSSPQ